VYTAGPTWLFHLWVEQLNRGPLGGHIPPYGLSVRGTALQSPPCHGIYAFVRTRRYRDIYLYTSICLSVQVYAYVYIDIYVYVYIYIIRYICICRYICNGGLTKRAHRRAAEKTDGVTTLAHSWAEHPNEGLTERPLAPSTVWQ